jgi:DNA-binding transcriptional ArsR family regulator
VIRSIQDIFTTSRTRILSQLKSRPHTVSELSRVTGYSKPTLFYHLERLLETGMVKRVENGRKWVYYELTEKGRRIIKQDIALMVSFLVAGISAILAATYRLLKPKGLEIERAAFPVKAPVKETPTPMQTPMPPVEAIPAKPDLLALVLIILGLILILLFIIYRRK